MIVLGVDVSFSATAWVVLGCSDTSTLQRPQVMNYAKAGDHKDAEAPADPYSRARRIMAIVEEVLGPVNEWNPRVIGIEDYSYGSVQNAHLLGELHGVLMHYLWRGEQVVDRIPIGTWRKLALGNGQTPKDQVRVEVMKRYGQEFKSLDVTEAFGIAVATWMRAIGADKPVSMRGRRRTAQAGEQPLDEDPFA